VECVHVHKQFRKSGQWARESPRRESSGLAAGTSYPTRVALGTYLTSTDRTVAAMFLKPEDKREGCVRPRENDGGGWQGKVMIRNLQAPSPA
jgi:hypothetical protein